MEKLVSGGSPAGGGGGGGGAGGEDDPSWHPWLMVPKAAFLFPGSAPAK
jgi:hypothetical protein